MLDGFILHWRSSHYAVTNVHNKNSNIQGKSQNVVKVIFNTIRDCFSRKEIAPSGSKFFPLKEVSILKRDAIEENQYLIQWSPFDVHNFCSVLATSLSCNVFMHCN